jgi:peptide/nickel transport system permease protein
MVRYLIERVVEMVPVLLLISVAAFFLIHLVPGDPARVNLPYNASPEVIQQRRVQLGLDRPLVRQYGDFISGAVTFEFGRSMATGESVGSLVARRAIPSFLLVGYSLVLTVLISVPLATLAAVRRGRWIDQAIRAISTVTFVMPWFWLALLLIIVFSLRLKLLPTSGYGDTITQHLIRLTLPALTMALALAPVMMRLLRSTMIETMQSEYIEAARARGLRESRVMFKHVLRNSATSSVTLLGILLGVLLSATVLVEQIFAIPGLGSLLVSAVRARDFPVVQALTLVFGTAMVVSSLLADLAYAALDPRVRL